MSRSQKGRAGAEDEAHKKGKDDMAKCGTKNGHSVCSSDLVRCKNCGTVGCQNASVHCTNSLQKKGVGSRACRVCGKSDWEKIK